MLPQVHSRNLANYVLEFLVDFGNAVNSQVTQTTLLEAGVWGIPIPELPGLLQHPENVEETEDEE
eukprot:4839089-Pyramimonas_sp.AAC.1